MERRNERQRPSIDDLIADAKSLEGKNTGGVIKKSITPRDINILEKYRETGTYSEAARQVGGIKGSRASNIAEQTLYRVRRNVSEEQRKRYIKPDGSYYSVAELRRNAKRNN
jgi:hypothetical protein